jgi:hypothetical protein
MSRCGKPQAATVRRGRNISATPRCPILTTSPRLRGDAVKTALAASKGEKVPVHIDTGVSVITKANMKFARSQELLNPKIK